MAGIELSKIPDEKELSISIMTMRDLVNIRIAAGFPSDVLDTNFLLLSEALSRIKKHEKMFRKVPAGFAYDSDSGMMFEMINPVSFSISISKIVREKYSLQKKGVTY